MLFAACAAGANAGPAASTAPVAADALMKLRRLKRVEFDVRAIPSSLSDGTIALGGPCSTAFAPVRPNACSISCCLLCSIIELGFAIWLIVAESRVSVNRSLLLRGRCDDRRQGVHGDPGEGPRGVGLVRQATARHDLIAGRASHRCVAGDSSAHPPNADGARLCRARGAAVLAIFRHSEARLCLSCDPELDRAGRAADASAQ